MGLAAWSADHLAACRAQGVKAGTIRQYERVETEFRAFIQSDDPADLTLVNARAWVVALGAVQRGLATSSIKHYVNCLKIWSRWLEAEEYVERDPLWRLKPPRVRPRVIQIFSPDQIQAMLRVAQEGPRPERDTAILYFALDTMVRAFELRAAVIPEALRQHPRDLGPGWMTISGKGDKERRIHYEAETAQVLAAYLDTRLDRQPWLFLGADDGQLRPDSFGHLVREWGMRANIRGVRCSPHTLRHTGAVRFLQAHPGHIAQLKMRLGHETLDMTLHYAERAEEESTVMGESTLSYLGLPV